MLSETLSETDSDNTLQIKYSKTLNTDYILFPEGYLCKDGTFIPKAEAQEASRRKELTTVYERRQADTLKYDFAKSYTEGKLVAQETTFPASRWLVIGCLCLVSVGAVITSVELSRRIQTINAGNVLGWILAVIMVLFETVAFSVSVEYKQKGNIAFSVLFFVMFCFVEFYSMTNTLQVFYNSFEGYQQSSYDDFEEINTIRTELEAVRTLKEQKLRQIEVQEKNLDYYREHAFGVKDLTEGLRILTEEYEDLVAKEVELNSKNAMAAVTEETKRKTFYDLLSDIFNVDGGVIAVILACFPALFIDLLAPFSASAALFLYRKK